MLNPEHVTSQLRKKSRTTFGSSINDSKEDEEQTCSNETRGRGGENLDELRKATFKKNLNPTWIR
jgi:hypothetical protein